jgi:hypothetical protein
MLKILQMAFILATVGVRCTPPAPSPDPSSLTVDSGPQPSANVDTRPVDTTQKTCGSAKVRSHAFPTCPDGTCAPEAHVAPDANGTPSCFMN